MARCRITWYKLTNGKKRKVSATTVARRMGAAYDVAHADICRHGPTTVNVGGLRYYGQPLRKGKYKRPYRGYRRRRR